MSILVLECEICGHAYSVMYMARTIVGDGEMEETITHCRSGRCADEAECQQHRTAESARE